jgi:predicted esterase
MTPQSYRSRSPAKRPHGLWFREWLNAKPPSYKVAWIANDGSLRMTKYSSNCSNRLMPAAMVSLLVIIVFAAAIPLRAEVMEKTSNVSGTTVHYKIVLPNAYDRTKAYPAILAFGGGPQTMNTVDSILTRNFRAEAEKRGYIVVAPAAPDDQLFFEEGARIFPAFLKMILADYKIQDNKFHIAGPSNGGIAAFHVAAANPQYFLSVTAFPGYMWEPSTAKLQAISKMCVFMYVGELDEYMWHNEMKAEAEFLRSKGTVARYTVEKGQPHRMETLANANAGRLFDGFEETKKGCSK